MRVEFKLEPDERFLEREVDCPYHSTIENSSNVLWHPPANALELNAARAISGIATKQRGPSQVLVILFFPFFFFNGNFVLRSIAPPNEYEPTGIPHFHFVLLIF